MVEMSKQRPDVLQRTNVGGAQSPTVSHRLGVRLLQAR